MPNDKVRFLKHIEEIKDKLIYIKEKDLVFGIHMPCVLELAKNNYFNIW